MKFNVKSSVLFCQLLFLFAWWSVGCHAAEVQSELELVPVISNQDTDIELKSVAARNIQLRVPASWKLVESKSKSRVAQFEVTNSSTGGEQADLVVYYFGGPTGGIEANMERWIGQFYEKDRHVELLRGKCRDGRYVLADISGTWKKPDGPPVARKTIDKPGSRVIGIILIAEKDDKEDYYFIKLSGADEFVKSQAGALRNAIGVDLESEVPFADSAADSVFQYDPKKVETGIVYQYVKSNIDGSRSGHVSLYVAAKDQLESFKWHEGGSEATLVIAKMDWERFSIGHFETWRLSASGEPQRRASLNYDEEKGVVVVSFGDLKMETKIKNWPWHSYDFDFASLNFILRHLVDPEKPFKVGITDIVRADDGPQLTDKGVVDVVYRKDVDRNGHACREYSIDGAGLENKGGALWVRKSDGVLVDYEIALPDEPGFKSGKLMLTGVERMTERQWKDFKTSRLSTK